MSVFGPKQPTVHCGHEWDQWGRMGQTHSFQLIWLKLGVEHCFAHYEDWRAEIAHFSIFDPILALNGGNGSKTIVFS